MRQNESANVKGLRTLRFDFLGRNIGVNTGAKRLAFRKNIKSGLYRVVDKGRYTCSNVLI